ncbi:HEAT repeat domain-containing protein [Halocella sp. SP3-1]|nr:HEAT repeat domain-containing protein [Halocella sp. SP3-1]
MEILHKALINFSLFIQKYPLYYFTAIGLFLIIMIIFLIRNKYGSKHKIKKIKTLLSKTPDQALDKISKNNLNITAYFLNEENLSPDEYILIKKYLSKPEQLKKIYYKIISSDNKEREKEILSGISILSKLSVSQAADYIITFLYEENPLIINTAIKKLAKFKTNKVIYSLIEFIKYSTDSNVLNNLKETLKKMGKKATDKLIPFIYEADPSTQIWYIDILGEEQNKEFYQVLLNLLASDNPEVKIHVLEKLSDYELSNKIIDKIIALLEDENWGVRSKAVKILGELEITKAAPALAKKMTDKSGVVRASATEALFNLGYEGIKYIFELAKKPEAPKEITDMIKKQDIAFIIESLEHIYQGDREQIESLNTKLSS